MSDDELVAWGSGYLAGWERSDASAELDGRPEPPPVELSIRSIEAGMWRKAWREIVLAGENPTEELIKERMWKLQT